MFAGTEASHCTHLEVQGAAEDLTAIGKTVGCPRIYILPNVPFLRSSRTIIDFQELHLLLNSWGKEDCNLLKLVEIDCTDDRKTAKTEA